MHRGLPWTRYSELLLIKAEGLRKDYGLDTAVDEVSFTIAKGEVVGLLGPNGSGKTTIMRMLTGFFAPTAGRCSIAGIDTAESPLEARRHVGYLPERVALYPDLSVRAYLSFVARVRETSGSVRAHVDEAMERCGLTDVSRKRIGKLSRGYRQRVGIAQAVVHKPDVLILDEPTVGLDPRQIVEVRSLIRELAGGVTVLLSTHILPEVSIVCRRVLILDHGRLIAQDTTEGLMAKTAGRNEIRLEIEAPEGEACSVLAACAGVSKVEIIERLGGSRLVFNIHARLGSDSKADLARAVVTRGWALHELTLNLLSLEDLFVEILARAERGDTGAEEDS